MENSIYLWDIAAGGLIAERAGARTEVLKDLKNFRMSYICTNGILHEEIKAVLERAADGGE